MTLDRETGNWSVEGTKEFSPQYCGGEHVFKESARGVHGALDVTRGMVTVIPARRTDLV